MRSFSTENTQLPGCVYLPEFPDVDLPRFFGAVADPLFGMIRLRMGGADRIPKKQKPLIFINIRGERNLASISYDA